MRPADTDLRIMVLLASVLAMLLSLYPGRRLCRLYLVSIPELILCHLDDSVLEQNVILRQYRQTVENRILASKFMGLLEKWRTRQYSKFLGGMYTSGNSRVSGISSGSREFENFDSNSQVS